MDRNISDLVSSAKAGDKQAFGELYREYFAPIYRFVLFKTKHKETAEDITQTAFARALGAMSNYRDKGVPFLSWLYTIARNLCLDHFKKKSDVVPADPDIWWAEVEGNLPADKFSQVKETSEALWRAMEALSDEQREVVVLRFIEEKSYVEIAELLDKNEEALRALNYRAMKILKEEMKKMNYEL